MKKSKNIVTALMLMTLGIASAASQEDNPLPDRRHSVRIGWGDMLSDIIAFRPSLSGTWASPEALPPTYTRHETYDYGFTGHFFAEYQYRLTRVTTIGGQADLEGIFWKEGTFDRYHTLVFPETTVRNWDLVLLLTARFTYLHRQWVRLYSGVGIGALLAFDNQGEFGAAPALNLNWLGVEVGNGPWGGTLELGALNALVNTHTIYQLFSRIFSLSVYYKW